MQNLPFYNASATYAENYDQGPFGVFKSKPGFMPVPKESVEIFGYKIDIPFGIPAGPLLNGNFIKAAWNWGYSLATYKTVRGVAYPCHPFPNIIKVKSGHPEIHPGDTVVGNLKIDDIDIDHDGITNSFGVPSQPPEVWQSDVKQTLAGMTPGNLLILSFVGTKTDGMTRVDYINDFARVGKMAKDTGAPVLEVNFSCPNVGKEGLICNDLETSADILTVLNSVKGNTPLLVKIGYFSKDQRETLNRLLEIIHNYADGVAAINTIQAKVTDDKGSQILPGSPVRLQSGICGSAIKWAGLEMADYITEKKKQMNWRNFVTIGVGGVVTPADYQQYLDIGVDAVQSATGAMWKPELAAEIRKGE
jgi:dihydroorotate dehydrogenase